MLIKAQRMETNKMSYIRGYNEVGIKDIPLVGGKNASLGEMYQALKKKGVNIPEGFIITADSFSKLLENKNISEIIYSKLDKLNTQNISMLETTGKEIRSLILNSGIPFDIGLEIKEAYEKLCLKTNIKNIHVAVRSSATAEDLPHASFAGQQETFLNVTGADALLEACLNCFASLFTNRAISYRASAGFDHRKVKLSIGVEQMIRSDLASSGVIFTLDTESGAKNVILITSAYGLGENIVAGRIEPDEFIVLKPVLYSALMPIIRKKLGSKQFKMIYSPGEGQGTKNIEVSKFQRKKFSIANEEVIRLAKWAKIIEDYFTEINQKEMPMDIEWAKDGESGDLFILQARPETVHSIRPLIEEEVMILQKKSKILLKGTAVGSKIGTGLVRVINDVSELALFKEGEILVADMTDPDWEPIMKKASGIITNHGGRTCHAAIVGREHGVPCIVGTEVGTKCLKPGQEITMSCAEGEVGIIMEGKLPFIKELISWPKDEKPRTKIMVNMSNPDIALKTAQMPVDGVGLARLEFIIAEQVKIHPMALLHFDKIKNKDEQKKIIDLIHGYENNPEKYFIEKLAEGIGMIAGAFYPRPVIVRLSDFKSNEYAHLIGGEDFEPKEENPMIGFRGASRYYSPRYKDGFALECEAIHYVREKMGLTNVKIMIPFCRSTKEGSLVIEEMAKKGLIRGKNGLEIYVMCEIPSNVMDIESFSKIFDGLSIGSNDLTQMTLGVDRDSELIRHLFDERDPAVLKMLELAVKGAKSAGRVIGICGQAPSDYPEIARYLVKLGIDSISLSADSVLKTLRTVIQAEKDMIPKL
jgi:pyruvate,water dikinase